MNYENRWKKLRLLGNGGQGTVHLVEDKQITRESDVLAYLQSDLMQVIRNVHGTTSEALQKAAAKMYGIFTDAVQGQIQNHHAALKVLHDVPVHGDVEKSRDRIRREIRVLKQLDHPNVVKLVDSSEDGTWFVMEYLSHGSLNQNTELFKGNLLRSLVAIRPLVEVLAELHQMKQVHRDVKPDNIFYSPDRGLVLGDFGLIFAGNTPEARLTLTEENVGSWQWMPLWTEYTRVEDVSPDFDVFSVGKVLWSMLTGRDRLHLWWFTRDSNNVEKMFPEIPEMRLVNKLFAKCIVENKDDCLPDCGALLLEIDRLIAYLEGKGGLLSANIQRGCQVCREGHYASLADNNVVHLRNLGFQPTGSQTYKVFSCDRCGHVEMFYSKSGDDPPAWRQD